MPAAERCSERRADCYPAAAEQFNQTPVERETRNIVPEGNEQKTIFLLFLFQLAALLTLHSGPANELLGVGNNRQEVEY